MSSLRVMVKRSRGKKQQEEPEKQQLVNGIKYNLFTKEDFILKKVFEITTRSIPARLIVASHGISHVVEDSWPINQQHHLLSLSSLPDYFLS